MLPTPTKGQIALVAQRAGGTMQHRWVRVEDVRSGGPAFQRALEWAFARNEVGENIFYTTGSFEGELSTFKGRTGANTVAQRSLYLDVDCAKYGIDAGTTGLDAIFEWMDVCPAVLVPSLVVNSGGGLHVYWVAHDDIPLDRWYAAADRLRNGAKEAFFAAVDVQCTIDRARILRVPGYTNHKYPAPVETLWPYGDHEQPLYTVDELEAMVAGWPRTAEALGASSFGASPLAAVLGTKPATKAPGKSKPAMASAFQAEETEDRASWARMELAAKTDEGCLVLRDAMADNGAVDYDVWCGLLTVIACTDNPEAGILAVSADHPDWGDEWNVDTAMNKAQSFGGPRRCATFSAVSPACGECKLRGQISSPVEVGRKHVRLIPQEAAITIDVRPAVTSLDDEPDEVSALTLPPAPKGFKYAGVNGSGGVWHVAEEGDVPLFETPVWMSSFHLRSDGTAAGVIHALDREGRILNCQHTGAAMTEAATNALLTTLVNHGVRVANGRSTHPKAFNGIMSSFLTALTSAPDMDRVEVIEHMGPHSATDRSRFDLGATRYHADGSLSQVTMKSGKVADAIPPHPPAKPEVLKAEWNAHLRGLHGVVADGLHGPERALDRMVTCMGFGAVLPTFLEAPAQQGGIISLTSPTGGSGKTSMVTTVLGIYSNNFANLIVSDGTRLGAVQRATELCALPLLQDDFTQNTRREDLPEALSNMLLASTSGGGRARADDRNPGFTTTWRWVTTNQNISTLVASLPGDNSGPLRRLFDLRVPMREGVTSEQRDKFRQFTDWLTRHGGGIGHLWVQHVVTHQAELAARYQHWRKVLVAECPALQNSQHEFIHSMATCTMVAAEAASQLGLHPYRVLDVQNTLVDFVEQSTGHFATSTAVEFSPVSAFLRSHLDSTCVKNRNGVSNFQHDMMPRANLAIRRFPDTGEVAILAKLVDRGVGSERMLAELATLGAVKESIDLGEGTHATARPVLCWTFKLPTTVTSPTTQS